MLTTIENNLVETIKAALGKVVRTVESHPGKWDAATMRHIATTAPGVFVVFDGGTDESGDADVVINGEWIAYAVTAHANGHTARRQGDGRQIGAYQIIETIAPLLHGHSVPDIGTLYFRRVRNAYSLTVERRGLSVYEVAFRMRFDLQRDIEGTLEDFETYDAEHTVGAGPTAFDEVTMEQS